ncbi:MAG: site-2 protease family protein [Clostridia bacterium]|nr:site-2 protease family protein [Clostridia bacterium]
MKFSFLGTKIYISFFFMAAITIMLATDRTGYMLPTLFAVVIHEAAHLFLMWVLDCAPLSVRLIPASVQINKKFSFSQRNDILIAASGPVANLLLFGCLYFNYAAFGNEMVLCYSLLNLIIGCFNLLPVKGLDGGTILYCIICKFKGQTKATLIMQLITLILAVAVIFVAVTLTFRHRFNISIYIVGIYLFIMGLMKF